MRLQYDIAVRQDQKNNMSTGLPEKYIRYERQIIISGFALEGQANLARGSAMVVGCGGLGCTIVQNLVRAGLGRLVICDDDTVQLPDLHRQLCYRESDIGRCKAQVAAEMLSEINSTIKIEPHTVRLDAMNIEQLGRSVDLIIDATDNLQTRSVINAYAVRAGKDWIYGGCRELAGTVMLIRSGRGACLECIFEQVGEPRTDEPRGPTPVLGSLPVLVGTIEATEAINYFVWPDRRPKRSKLINIDLTKPRVQTVEDLKKNPDCRECGRKCKVKNAK